MMSQSTSASVSLNTWRNWSGPTSATHEILLVLDATTGMNALNQAREFHKAVPLTGLIVTKLDGTSKGGMVVAILKELGLPIKFIGLGEQPDD
jgi:fused signal recognition particle receptor